MPGLVEVALDETLAAPESCHSLAYRGLELAGNLLGRPGDLQAASAAAERRLDRDRQPVLGRERGRLVGTADRAVGAGRERRADLLGDVPRLHLVPERLDRGRRRPDPGQPGVADSAGKV